MSIQPIGDQWELAQPLAFPEINRLSVANTTSEHELLRGIREIIKRAPHEAFFRKLPTKPTVNEVSVTVTPRESKTAWRDPLELKLSYVSWLHADQTHVGFVPALNLDLIGNAKDNFQELVARQVRLAIARADADRDLSSLSHYANRGEVRLRFFDSIITVDTPKAMAVDDYENQPQDSILRQVAVRIPTRFQHRAFEVDQSVSRLAKRLTESPPASVLLVGPSGVGKTSIVRELMRRHADFDLRRDAIWTTNGSRLVAGMCGFGEWQERCQKLVAECEQREVIVHVENLFELTEVGKGGGNRQGIADFLRPHIARGRIRVIAECTPAQQAQLEKENPQLLHAFTIQPVHPPERDEMHSILTQVVEIHGNRRGVPVDDQVVDCVERLHHRYATYSANPGRPVRFLRNVLDDARRESVAVTATDIITAFGEETGLPVFMLDDQTPLDVAASENQLQQRVIGQASPIRLIVDVLATIKARMTPRGRPIASFLFAGPTGVGKTETAKALAEFMYRDEQRMIRFDLSEYSDPWAAERLIGTATGRRGLLTDQIRQHPFSVVLLDEFEKAHPQFFDLLLQVLGEGRLTDGRGELADFSNCIIIMTSNLGAESYRASPLGFAETRDLAVHATDHFVRKVREFVRPEFFNRIDRIVPFAPLAEADVRRIADRELHNVLRREGLAYRDVSMEVGDDVLPLLAKHGYDVRYGARPLKRKIESRLVLPISKALNRFDSRSAVDVSASTRDDQIHVSAAGNAERTGSAGGIIRDTSMLAQLTRIATLRRNVQLLDASEAVIQIRNQIFRLQRQREIALQAGTLSRLMKRWRLVEHELAAQEELDSQVIRLKADVESLEDRARLHAFGYESQPETNWDGERDALEARLTKLLIEIFVAEVGPAEVVTMGLYSRSKSRACELFQAYESIAAAGQCRRYPYAVMRPNPSRDGRAKLRLKEDVREDKSPGPEVLWPAFAITDLDEFLAAPPSDLFGLLIEISGPAAYALFSAERGTHLFQGDAREQVLCHVFEGPAKQYKLPVDIAKLGPFDQYTTCRRYDTTDGVVYDNGLNRKFNFDPSRLRDVVEQVLTESFESNLRSILGKWN